MQRGDDMRSLDEIFRDAQPSISFAPVNETPKPSGQVLGREFYYDSAGRTIVGDTVTDQMGGGANVPEEEECPATLTVILSGITFCDECYNGMLVNDVSFNGTYELTLDSSDPCAWSGTGGTIRKRFYEAEDCSGSAIYDQILPCGITVTLTAGEYEVSVFENTTVSVALFYAIGTSTTLSNGEGLGSPACGGSAFGARVVATGGTIAIS